MNGGVSSAIPVERQNLAHHCPIEKVHLYLTYTLPHT